MQAEQEIFILDAAYTDEPGIATLPDTGPELLVPVLLGVTLACVTYILVLKLQSARR